MVTLHGYHLADVPGAAILSTWDFQACVVVTLHGYHLADVPEARGGGFCFSLGLHTPRGPAG